MNGDDQAKWLMRGVAAGAVFWIATLLGLAWMAWKAVMG